MHGASIDMQVFSTLSATPGGSTARTGCAFAAARPQLAVEAEPAAAPSMLCPSPPPTLLGLRDRRPFTRALDRPRSQRAR